MRDFVYSEKRNDREEFIDECIGLENVGLSKYILQKYSSLLNRYYPKHALHGSHAVNQWIAARNNLDTLFTLNGVDPPKHPSKTQQIVVGVTIGVVTFIITSILTVSGAMLLNSGVLDKFNKVKTAESSKESVEITPKNDQESPALNKSSNADGEKAAAGS